MNIVVRWKNMPFCSYLFAFEDSRIFFVFNFHRIYDYISLSWFAMSSGIIPTWVTVKKKNPNSPPFSRYCRCLYSKTMVWWWIWQWLTMPSRDSNWSHHKFKISKNDGNIRKLLKRLVGMQYELEQSINVEMLVR